MFLVNNHNYGITDIAVKGICHFFNPAIISILLWFLQGKNNNEITVCEITHYRRLQMQNISTTTPGLIFSFFFIQANSGGYKKQNNPGPPLWKKKCCLIELLLRVSLRVPAILQDNFASNNPCDKYIVKPRSH